MTFFLQTFGCKSNQYESQAVREALRAAGFAESPDPRQAGVAVVNTCGVTGRAGASCRNALRKIRRANPDCRLVITGCAVDLNLPWPELPGDAPLLVPNGKKHAIVRLIRDGASPDAIPEDRLGLSISSFHGHTRAFLKIQDGCDNFCSYCAVPFARGRPASRPAGEILAEAGRLVESGHREIVLTGINIGAYDHAGLRLAGLALALSATPGLERLRLGSVEPPYVTEELVLAMRETDRICPHVHVPLQSGDDGVLGAMGRRYSAADFLEKISLLKTHLANPAVTTDVIVGFPGETARSAEATEELCGRAGFSRMHVFLFSARPGTRAAALKRTATDGEIEGWKNRLTALGRDLAAAFARSCVGMGERVIFERSGVGLTDRYLRLTVPCQVAPGESARVLVVSADGVELRGEILDGSFLPCKTP